MIAIAVVHALRNRVMPLGDNGLIVLRADDVLTANHPWLGTWTSASLQTGIALNNPAPLHFELLATMVKPFGPVAGSTLGAALINAAAALIAVRAGWRVAGRCGALAASLASTAMAWSLGSSLLVDPWQPHNLMLPLVALLFLCVALVGGDARSAPWAVGLGSVIVGAHLSFVYLVLGLLVVGAGGWWWSTRGTPRRWTSWIVAAVVGALAWAQTLWEQLRSSGEGNVSRILRSNGVETASIGAGTVLRAIAQVVALPPWWARPSFDQAIHSDDADYPVRMPGLGTGLVALVLVVAALALAGWWWVRRRSRLGMSMTVVAAAALALVTFTALTMPRGIIGLSAHQMRWLWPVSLLVSGCIAGAALSAVNVWAGPRLRSWREVPVVPGALAAATVLLAVLALPARGSTSGPMDSMARNGTVRTLYQQLERVTLPGPAVFDVAALRFAEPYSGPIVLALLSHGQPLRFSDDGFVRQVGERRRADGGERYVVALREGSGPLAGETALASAVDPSGRPITVVIRATG